MNTDDLVVLLDEVDDVQDLNYLDSNFKVIEQGNWEEDGKWCFCTSVVQYGDDKYFEITESRSNSGYWGDSENGDTTVREVKPVTKTVTITEWVVV